MLNKKYVIITSAYNEEQHIEYTIKSIIKQTILPSEWIIVNDGSTDKTELIILKYANRYNFIRLLNKQKDNVEFGAHVGLNFKLALSFLEMKNWEYIAQLDADIEIDREDFYEYQIKEFIEDPKLGISSGITYSIIDNRKIVTRRPYWRTGGATKLYRRKCFYDIGGIIPCFAWDGIDVYKAMFRWWKSRTFFNLHVKHLGKHRMTNREMQIFKAQLNGKNMYQRGYPIEFVLFKILKYFIKRGKLQSRALWKGYKQAISNNEIQFVSMEEKKYIRKIQYLRIIDKFTKRRLL